jgi:hypothetical protein
LPLNLVMVDDSPGRTADVWYVCTAKPSAGGDEDLENAVKSALRPPYPHSAAFPGLCG